MNPYVKLEQLAAQMQLHSAQELTTLETLRESGGGAAGKNRAISSLSLGRDTNIKAKAHSSTGNKLVDINFDRWFLFCQRCRHGGHTHCITSWFDYNSKVSFNLEPLLNCFISFNSIHILQGEQSRSVCGVNGCNCECLTVT